MPVVRSNSTALSLAEMCIGVVGNKACEEAKELHPSYCGYLEVGPREVQPWPPKSVRLHQISVLPGLTCCSWELLEALVPWQGCSSLA